MQCCEMQKDNAPVPSLGVTGAFARFIAQCRFEDLPEAALVTAKRGVLDYLAVTLAGSSEPVGKKIIEYVKNANNAGDVTLIGAGFKSDVRMAALANGTMSHAMDYDDVIHVTPFWLGHPSVTILSAVLAAAEKYKNCGKDLLLAYCVGMEIYVKSSLYCGDDPYKNGWHNLSYIGTMASTAAVAKLMGLNETQIKNAFGIAASMACGIRRNFGTMTKPLHAGLAARNAVEAAALAAIDFTAHEEIYEAPLGFRSVFNGKYTDTSESIPLGLETLSRDEFAARLGNPWNIAEPGMSFKLCPSCRATHFGMEAGLLYRENYAVEPEKIVEIECHVPDHMEGVLLYHDPVEGLQGKFSLEYILAKTVLSGTPGLNDFTDEKVNDPAVKALIKKIKWISFKPEAGSFGCPEYIFKFADGTQFSAQVEYPRGEPENPVNDEILLGKYLDCAGVVLGDDAKNEIKNIVMNLENSDDISRLFMLLGNF